MAENKIPVQLISLLKASIITPFFVLMLFSCRQDIKTVNIYGELDTLPELTAKNIEYSRSDSGVVQAILTSPLMNEYSDEGSYFEFPEGFRVEFYDSTGQVKSVLTALYGIGYEKQKLMVAKNNVVIINYEKNETLNTEKLIWDQRKRKIFSDVDITITTDEEVLYGKGLVSDESFEKYEILKPTGEFQVEDDEK